MRPQLLVDSSQDLSGTPHNHVLLVISSYGYRKSAGASLFPD
jgi:hypothetical protein